MRRIRDVQELKACIQRCRRADLDRLIKLTNLPRGGLKQDIQMRLISYLEQDPSTEFISALHELRTLMYGATNIQFSRQRNGNSNPPYSSDDPPASLLYLTAAANRSLELLENNTGPHPYLSSSKTNYGCQKDQSFCNLPTSQSHPNSTSVVQQSSFSGVNIAKEREQQFQNEDSFNQLMHRSSLSVNPMINPSVWAAWTSANKLLPEHQSAANSQLCSSQSPQTSFSNFHSCSRTAATSSLSTSSSSNMTVVNSSLSKYSECTQSTVGAPCSESKIATITYKIGPLITLAGANGSFRLPAVLPEFHFMESPFFKLLDVLLPPQVILPAHIGFATGRRSYDRSLALRFTSDQAETITYHCWRGADERMEFGVQVIMRFGRLNPQACENLVQTYELTGSRKSGSFS
ncbi:unnamed protein product [Heterobilharzia americana]|nr:unnamed protein product [Heterobilharzia americana]